MNQINTFTELLAHQLQDMLSNSSHAGYLLPKMSELAQNSELGDAMRQAGERCQRHQQLLRESLQELGAQQEPETCQTMIGMIQEGNHLLDHIEDRRVRDAALVVIAQKMQHYGIASLGSIKAHAEQLDQRSIVKMVDQILNDEKKLDKRLTKLAESCVNQKALTHA